MTFTDSSVVLSQNQPWLMESQPVWSLLRSRTAGHPITALNAAASISSMKWCRQARYRMSLSNFCSKRMQAPARCPVFDNQVSKNMALTRSAMLQSCSRVYTAAAVFSPVPLVSFGTPSSLFTSWPDTRTVSRSTCSFPVRSCKSFRPSGLQAKRNLYRKGFLHRGSKIGSTSLSLASDGVGATAEDKLFSSSISSNLLPHLCSTLFHIQMDPVLPNVGAAELLFLFSTLSAPPLQPTPYQLQSLATLLQVFQLLCKSFLLRLLEL